jgi:GNAT superfamily N-acetyltransferase
MVFFQACYSLGEGHLRPVGEGEAEWWGERLVTLTPWRELGYRGPALGAYLSRPDPALYPYTLAVAGEAAGLICVRYPWLRGPYLELLAVLPAYQGQGWGRRLLNWLVDQVRGREANLWTLVSAFNTRAREFYRGCGFVEIGPIPHLVREGYEEILLRKVIH